MGKAGGGVELRRGWNGRRRRAGLRRNERRKEWGVELAERAAASRHRRKAYVTWRPLVPQARRPAPSASSTPAPSASRSAEAPTRRRRPFHPRRSSTPPPAFPPSSSSHGFLRRRNAGFWGEMDFGGLGLSGNLL
ncbi:hypothetical protein SLA2020_387690 [Shorea laevis]